MSTTPVTPVQQIPFPSITLKEVEGFIKVWKSGIVVLDEVAKEFARDMANVALRSFVIDQMQKVAKIKEAQRQAEKKLIVEG